MFPLFLDLAGKTVLVVGGGPVGRRKAQAALAAGATVRVVDLQPRPPGFPEAVNWLAEAYQAEHLDGVTLVFAAGPPALNRQVTADAQARNLWVNSASHPEQSDFFVPATLRRGLLTLAISTGGASPALARRLRETLDVQIDPLLADWLTLLDELRPHILAAIPDEAVRRELLDHLADWPWLDALRARTLEQVRSAMTQTIAARTPLSPSPGENSTHIAGPPPGI